MTASLHKSSLMRLTKHLKNYKLRFLGIFIALSFAAFSVLGIGFAIKQIINKGFGAQDISSLNSTILLLFGVAAILAIASAVRAYLIESTAERIITDIRTEIYNKLIHTSPYYFEVNRVSDIVSRLLNDTSLIQSVINTVFSFFIRNSLMIIGGIILLLATSLKLSLYIIFLIPIAIIPVIILGKKVKANSKKSQASIAGINSHLEETLSSIKTVQAYNMQGHEVSRFINIIDQYLGYAIHRISSKSYLVAILIFSISAVTAVITWLGGRMVLQGVMSPGELVSFIFYAIVVASAIGGMSEVIADLNRAAGGADRITELLSSIDKQEIRHGVVDLKRRYEIEFRNIEFSYPTRPDIKVVNDFSMIVKKGEKIALSGVSGSGKSTILQLLLGFYELQKGDILIGKKSIRKLDITKLRDAIAFVSQDTFIFSASAYDNIAYGRFEATKEEVFRAAELANIDEFIVSLPHKYDSFLGEKGVNLSGGQKQRIAIARAILKDPEILILDEATNNLDRHNELLVQKAIDHLMEGRTTFVVSHSKDTISKCDKIILMEPGKIKNYNSQFS